MRDREQLGTLGRSHGSNGARSAGATRTLLMLGLVGLAGACGSEGSAEGARTEALAVVPSPNVDARRSLAITDQPILANFTLARVLSQLIATSGVTGLSATTLFQQWWDTQNPGPGLGLG